MKQLVFDDNFEIIDEPLSFWKTNKDIPEDILKFILLQDESIDIKDYFTCPICGNLVNDDFYCSDCMEYPEDIKEEFTSYYAFDVVEGEVFLYRILKHRIIRMSDIQSMIRITNAYHVESDGITDFYSGKKYSEYSSELKDANYCMLYTNNLDLLKATVYRYTYLWLAKDYLSIIQFNLYMLCFLPFTSNKFDFLMKNGLFSLAFYSMDQLKGKSFEEIFGVDKKFLPFMREHDLNYSELEALRICKEADKELIEYTRKNRYKLERILEIVPISVSDIKKYLEKDDNDIDDYADYLRFANELGIDLKNKKYLYPENLVFEHAELQQEILYRNDPEMDEAIQFLSNVLTFNRYEDENYIIFPAPDVDSMFDEAKQQANCLASYCEAYSNNLSQIYFMREKKNLGKSFVTIEVFGTEVVQARMRFNEKPSSKIMSIIKEWEKTLVPIEKE
ncbi:MAG: PcfJ domain-containing protein [Bacilli bacterium]|nr:PcfJ domain-containing protein [Bacilli bacterium]